MLASDFGRVLSLSSNSDDSSDCLLTLSSDAEAQVDNQTKTNSYPLVLLCASNHCCFPYETYGRNWKEFSDLHRTAGVVGTF